jgi:hypothetical protein
MRGDKWRINGKGFGSGRDPILMYYYAIRLEELRKTIKTSIKIAGLQAEIWTRDLQNMNQEC